MADNNGSSANLQEPPSYLPTTKTKALRFAAKGKPVFPCRSDKSPYTLNGFKDATTDPAQVSDFWTRFPDALVGMPTGPASGVFVIDVDRLDALGELPEELPETLTARTRSGGRHYYFHHVPGISNSTGGLPKGVDVRGEGGYVIVPPSTGYCWEDRAPLADAPTWLVNILREKPEHLPVSVLSGNRTTVNLDSVDPISVGTRNRSLTSIGGKLRAYGFERPEIEASLLRVNTERCSPPLPDEEVRKVAASVARYLPGNATPPPDTEAQEAIAEIEAELWASPWPRTGGKSERSLTIVALLLARRHGRKVAPGTVEISVSHRALALAAATSRKAVQRTIKRSAWLHQGRGGEGRKSGSIVLSTPCPPGSAKRPHSNHRGSIECGEAASGDTLRSPLSAPRLRWSAPGNLRLGKSAEAVVDYLEKVGGAATIEDLAEFMHVGRVRDFRRRVIGRLEERGIVTVAGETVSLVDKWLDALNVEREVSGEIAAFRRDLDKFNRQRKAYAERGKHISGHAPSKDDMARVRNQRVQDALDVLQESGTGPEMVMQTYLAGETKTFDYVVNAVAFYYGRSSPEVWREAVADAVKLIGSLRSRGAA